MSTDRFQTIQEVDRIQADPIFPIIIEKAALYIDQPTFSVILQCKLRILNSVVNHPRSASIKITGFNDKNELVQTFNHTYQDINLIGEEMFGSRTPILLDRTVRKVELCISQAVDSEGAVLTPASAGLPDFKRIKLIFLNDEQHRQIKNTQRPTNPNRLINVSKIETLPAFSESYYLCSCGHINPIEHLTCARCSLDRDWQLENLEISHVDAKIKAAKELAAEQEKFRQLKIAERKQKTRLVFLRFVLPAIILIALLTAGFFGSFYYAGRLADNNEFNKAIWIYEKFGELNHAPEWIQETKYRQAVALLHSNSFDEAKAIFQQIPDYGNAQVLAKDADYRKALSLYTSGNLNEARAIYSSLGSYGDAASQITVIDYDLATQIFNNGDYIAAQQAFTALGTYKDSSDMAKESRYLHAINLFEDNKYVESKKLFVGLGNYKQSPEYSVKADYTIAVALHNAGDRAGALEIFKTINFYEDVPSLISSIYYSFAQDKLAADDLKGAFEYWEKIKGYEDVDSLIEQHAYPAAIEHYNKGEWQVAIYYFGFVDPQTHIDVPGKLKAAEFNDEQAQKKIKYDEALTYIQKKDYKKAYDILVGLKYSNSDSLASYYSLLAYPWQVTIHLTKSSFSRSDHFSAEFNVSGGPPGKTMNLTMSCTMPNGGKLYETVWNAKNGNGWTYSCYYSNWRYGSTGTGKFVAKNYDTGEKLAEINFRVTY